MILDGETVRVKLKNNPDLEFTHCSSIEFMDRGFVKFTSEEDPTGMCYYRIINKDEIVDIYYEKKITDYEKIEDNRKKYEDAVRYFPH